MLSALDGLPEYDIRRPTPSATNLLGLTKHVAGVEFDYLGNRIGRPAPVRLPWVADESIWDGAGMRAMSEQTRDELVELYRTAWRHSDESIEQPPLDTPGAVPWWPEDKRHTTPGSLLVRVVAETAQQARVTPTSCARWLRKATDRSPRASAQSWKKILVTNHYRRPM